MQALLCLQCGGPLGAVKSVPAIVECGFCGAVINVSERPVLTQRGTLDELLRASRIQGGRKKFTLELQALVEAKMPPFEAVRTAAAHHLGTGGETDALARVTIALARDFEREHEGASVVGEVMVLCRVVDAYFKCVHELQSSAEAEINLPFITVTSKGPVHFLRRITADDLAALAARDPNEPAPKPPIATADAAHEGDDASRRRKKMVAVWRLNRAPLELRTRARGCRKIVLGNERRRRADHSSQ